MGSSRCITEANLSVLEDFHYIFRLKKANDYWGGFKLPTLEDKKEKYQDNFNIIIPDSQGSGDFYSIPFPIIEPLLIIEKGFLSDQQRWHFSIKRHILDIHGSDERVDITESHLNYSNIPQLINIGNELAIDEASVREHERLQKKRIRKKSRRDIRERAFAQKAGPVERLTVISHYYPRNGYVADYAHCRANGICQLCKVPAPFKVDEIPFLEVHHIIPLSQGGSDTVDNTVALCPNCHRKAHRLNQEADRQELKAQATQKPKGC